MSVDSNWDPALPGRCDRIPSLSPWSLQSRLCSGGTVARRKSRYLHCCSVTMPRVRIPFRVPPAATRSFDVAGLGENSIDSMVVVAEYPASNTKQRMQRYARQPGGQIATALVACARLGLKARYIGRFGDDDGGCLARESLDGERVDTTAALTI